METDENEAKSPVLIIKVILATICMFGAFTGFLLSIWKDNYYAVPACLILELVCVGILQLNSMYIKGKLFEKFTYTKLRIFMYGAALLWLITLAGSIYYLVSAVTLKQVAFNFNNYIILQQRHTKQIYKAHQKSSANGPISEQQYESCSRVTTDTWRSGFYPEKDGFYFALIPCGLANVFSLWLVYDSRKFMNMSAERREIAPQNMN
ncbi:hypothetical protein CDAR_589912 [Caerostris darwini]|uniref:Uncharacterized protein n=1 Tax=Caerostris darwini TaxID=1538125 RepID=A0AAV4NWD8_9ARAC|nr:hypothetical protein CDAR_589912 [Caerostris darwini]